MPTMIHVITQDEFDQTILPISNLTMAILPQVPKKKYVQRDFYFEKLTQPRMAKPTKEITRKMQVPEHIRGSTRIKAHTRIVKRPSGGKKREIKTNNSKKKTGQAKHGAFAKIEIDCKHKKDAQYAHIVYLKQLSDSARGIKN